MDVDEDLRVLGQRDRQAQREAARRVDFDQLRRDRRPRVPDLARVEGGSSASGTSTTTPLHRASGFSCADTAVTAFTAGFVTQLSFARSTVADHVRSKPRTLHGKHVPESPVRARLSALMHEP